ncbi:MAG: lactate racemase domain-containing protein [Verrucomicrobiota bacterium]
MIQNQLQGALHTNTAQVTEWVKGLLTPQAYQGKKVLLIIPDGTRSAPIGLMFKSIFDAIGLSASKLDILVALGTHPPMSEEAICGRLEISMEERKGVYSKVVFYNHEWDNPKALRTIGKISREQIKTLSDGLFDMEVSVEVNSRIYDYDEIIIIGPVFPHEVVGFSGGNKYLFPGVSGPEVLNFFHWLGAVVTNARTIGHQWTPVRKVVDYAGGMVQLNKKCFALVVNKKEFHGVYWGTPEEAWKLASDHSRKVNIDIRKKPYHTILSCAPEMYDELWVAGKCMYKLEPVLADGGELIIYAPHLHEVSITHGKLIKELGYHCRDYFVKQWDKFKHYPWGVLAHSTHVYGQGTYVDGIETPRARVTLATGLSEAECKAINFGYRDWRTINVKDFENREDEGVLYIPKAGEVLFQLENPPEWARVV